MIIAIQCQVSKRKIQIEIKTLWQKLELTLRNTKGRVQRKEIQDRPVAVSTNITLVEGTKSLKYTVAVNHSQN